MPRKKGKAISFDAMVKFFMQNYDIPTKKDVNRLMAKLDYLERLIKLSSTAGVRWNKNDASRRKASITAMDMVLDIFRHSASGLGVAEIQDRTGFGKKKIRNILFRLNKAGKIRRLRRGVYIAA